MCAAKGAWRLALCIPFLLLTLQGCGTEQSDPAAAARADSSAAGYEVGDADADRALAVVAASAIARRTGPLAARVRDNGIAAVESIRGGAQRAEAAPAEPAPAAGPPEPAAPGAASPTAGNGRRRTDPPPAQASPQPAPQPSPLPPAVTPPPEIPDSLLADSVGISPFAWYDHRSKVVRLTLISGYNALNGSFNFNGGAHGAHVLTVPVGWRVEIAFANRDVELSHSASVIPDTDPLPVMMPPAAFPGAFSVRLEQGLTDGATDEIAFSVARAGRYQVVCGVPGHAESGMWMRLVVSDRARLPSYGM